jgi:hypothetical protein
LCAANFAITWCPGVRLKGSIVNTVKGIVQDSAAITGGYVPLQYCRIGLNVLSAVANKISILSMASY